MTREEYIEIRNKNAINHVYEYYLENIKKSKFNFTVPIEDFINFFRIWEDAQIVYNNITAYYDHKFEVNKLENLKTGQIIKFL